MCEMTDGKKSCRCRGQMLEQRVRELEARLEATARVLFKMANYNKNFRDALLDHLFSKKISRKELIDRANDAEQHQRDKDNYYTKFAVAIESELEKMEVKENER